MVAAENKAHTTWSAYEGSVDSDQYSALKQINKSNVKPASAGLVFIPRPALTGSNVVRSS